MTRRMTRRLEHGEAGDVVSFCQPPGNGMARPGERPEAQSTSRMMSPADIASASASPHHKGRPALAHRLGRALMILRRLG